MIFVFGSNEAERHGRGAALYIKQHHDAVYGTVYGTVYGVGEGLTGNSYALPTKDFNLRTRPLEAIELSVDRFLDYARSHPELKFEVTKIGCGLAEYQEHQIKPMFANAPANCFLPEGWRD